MPSFALPLMFAVTLFASASLLFLVQPMIGKMILPRLGGTPAVWNTCMVFFQAALLAGYAYTHAITTKTTVRMQLIIQCCFLTVPLLFAIFGVVLPFGLGTWTPPRDSNPIFSVMFILTFVVGLPFFLVATTAPLLQRWFAHTGHPSSKDPYFLYGASNLGSMVALLSYPFLIEPNSYLEDQAVGWAIGYGVFIAMVMGCALVVALSQKKLALVAIPSKGSNAVSAPLPAEAVETSIKPGKAAARGAQAVRAVLAKKPEPVAHQITGWRRVRWVMLAAAPTSLLLGVTTYMTTDIAAIPLLWISPLALYLLTFIFVFMKWPVTWTAQDTKGMPLPLVLAFVALVPLNFLFAVLEMPDWEGGGLQPWHLKIGFAGFSLLILFGMILFGPLFYASKSWRGSPHWLLVALQPVVIAALGIAIVNPRGTGMFFLIALHLSAFFVTTLVCHGELARDRPGPEGLTEFYLWMSVGGVLGGLFNALIAPSLGGFFYPILANLDAGWFKDLLSSITFVIPIEYLLVTACALMLRPVTNYWSWLFRANPDEKIPTWQEYLLDVGYGVCLGLFAFALIKLLPTIDGWSVKLFGGRSDTRTWFTMIIMTGIPLVLCMFFVDRPVRFGLGIAGLIIANTMLYHRDSNPVIHRSRSFFGTLRVELHENKMRAANGEPILEGEYYALIHGGINHGWQNKDESRRQEPITYFHPTGGIGQVFSLLKKGGEETIQKKQEAEKALLKDPNNADLLAAKNANPPPYAVVGLGIGTLASYALPGQKVDFYEIDPAVKFLSLPPEGWKPYFYYLSDAKNKVGANVEVIMGDGLLTLSEAPKSHYRIIVMDAFASDAIPIHLLTLEALDMYLSKMDDEGVVIFNVTNRYVHMHGVLAELAHQRDLICLGYGDYSDNIPTKFSSDWVMMARKRKDKDVKGEAAASLVGTMAGGPWMAFAEPAARAMPRPNYPWLFRQLDASKWNVVPRDPRLEGRVWTEKYSNLLDALRSAD